jgi:hypothetical protein
MSRKASGEDSLANASLSTSRVPPQQGVGGDRMASTRNLSGNDHEKGLDAMADKKKVGSSTASMPKEGQGGTNARGGGKTQGEEGSGAQKRKQKK